MCFEVVLQNRISLPGQTTLTDDLILDVPDLVAEYDVLYLKSNQMSSL